MLQYLIVLLDSTSTSFCHYENTNKTPSLISIENLKDGILYSMKENLSVQFVYPDYELPQEYKDTIDTVDHSVIVSSNCNDQELLDLADVVVFNTWQDIIHFSLKEDMKCVLRTRKDDLFKEYKSLPTLMESTERINVVITDVETFTEEDFNKYKDVLDYLSDETVHMYKKGSKPQLNILTDRIVLKGMNNCNAGSKNITLAPDGNFYVCPAFYLADDEEDYGLGKAKVNIGSLKTGLDIKNQRLYNFVNAPLCRICDAFQCKRCIWLNRKSTYEVNTPGHEQCVVAHLERNASRNLLLKLRKEGFVVDDIQIAKIDYLDPLQVVIRRKGM